MGYAYGTSRKALRPAIPTEELPKLKPAPVAVVVVQPKPKAKPKPKRKAEPKPKPKPRALKPCGTNAAYGRHLQRGEQPCRACMEAHTEYVARRRDTPPEKRIRAEAICGTHSGAIRHYRNREALCDPCAVVRRAYKRELSAKKRFAAEAQKAYDAAMLANPEDVTEGPLRAKELAWELELVAMHRRSLNGTPLEDAA